MLRNLGALARARPPVVSPRRFMPRTKIKERTGDEPGKLILIRHGESTWNASKLFTGWVDVDLSETGVSEVEHAARLLLERGYRLDVIYTSVLKRAIRSTMILLDELRQTYRPVVKDWRLNERHYGALQGLSKKAVADVMGLAETKELRKGYDAKPPALPAAHTLSPLRERKYAEVDVEELPLSESLRECLEREIDAISDESIEEVVIPNAIPLVYRFDRGTTGKLKAVRDEDSASELVSGMFLEKKGLLRAALEQEKRRVVDEHTTEGRSLSLLSPLERSLTTLESRRECFDERGASTRNVLEIGERPQCSALLETRAKKRARRSIRHPSTGGAAPPPLLVIIRHGKTEHNKLGLFTGWEDAGLAPEGRAEAEAAGELMAAHGIKLDVVYTSWLSRAIETAWLALTPLDMVWLPIVKTWRLNERMYGALTGLSKRMIQQEYGDDQFRRWRRGFDERPPPVSPFSPHYPGNDGRYTQYVHDLPVSFLQTAIRSLAHGRYEIHHDLPKTESLKDCMERTVPYYDLIERESLDRGKNVLIASSENAIRGLLMNLCDIPADEVHGLEIPTGVPLLYDFEHGCLRLLDDQLQPPPRERYEFGAAADLLFTPRELRAAGGDAPDPHAVADVDARGTPSASRKWATSSAMAAPYSGVAATAAKAPSSRQVLSAVSVDASSSTRRLAVTSAPDARSTGRTARS
ncbi:phosphoglycerate mutase [Aureococcus anophagefferens]|nr:phosphoglycerate mutase [Aureococcus anophagefferens]